MTERHDLGEVDAFTAGAIGRPGQRTFFLQARVGHETVSVKCEKQQVAALGEYLQRLLDDLAAPTDQPLPSALELAEPTSTAFVLGPIAIGIDPHHDRVVLQLAELVEADDTDPDDDGGSGDEMTESDDLDVDDGEHGMVRVALTRGQVRAFCLHAAEIVSAGRPSCRWCGRPIDPDGHPCARMN